MEELTAERIVGSAGWFAVLAAALAVLGALVTLRWTVQGTRTVVVRRSRIVRRPSRRLVALWPVVEQARDWPPDLVDLLLEVRATSRDGQEVRVLAAVVVWVPPPRLGQVYADPRVTIPLAAREAVSDAVAVRDAPALADPDSGLVAALAGACLRGESGQPQGVVATIELDEVEVLLPVPERRG